MNLGKYCNAELSSTLTLVLEDSKGDAINLFKKPLHNVECVEITGNTRLNFQQLNEKFTNMKYLQLSWIQIGDGKSIECFLSTLTHFEVEITDQITEENVQKAVQLNPQLCEVVVKQSNNSFGKSKLMKFFNANFIAPGKNATVTKIP